jgi:hypothetical protein
MPAICRFQNPVNGASSQRKRLGAAFTTPRRWLVQETISCASRRRWVRRYDRVVSPPVVIRWARIRVVRSTTASHLGTRDVLPCDRQARRPSWSRNTSRTTSCTRRCRRRPVRRRRYTSRSSGGSGIAERSPGQPGARSVRCRPWNSGGDVSSQFPVPIEVKPGPQRGTGNWQLSNSVTPPPSIPCR